MLMPDLDLGQDLGCGEPRVHIHALSLSLVLRERSSSMSVISHSISPALINLLHCLSVCLSIYFSPRFGVWSLPSRTFRFC